MAEVTRKLAVCRIGLRRAASGFTGVWTPQTLTWLFDPGNPVGLAAYWHQVTGGVVTITTDLLDLGVVTSDLLVANVRDADRGVGLNACVAVATARDIDLDGYDGVVFCVQGEPANAGAGGIVAGGQRLRAALLDELGSHSFMAHEVGHVLGLDHPFRSLYTGSQNGEYGDPVCIMSAESYGGEPVVFPLVWDAASGIPPESRFWQSAGPGVSMATLWRFTTGFGSLPGHGPLLWPTYVHRVSAQEAREQVTINRPGLGGTTLVVIHDETSNRFLTVEYRPARDWDRALGSGRRDLSDPGVVIHSVGTAGTRFDGTSWPKLDRIWYERTLRETDLDLDWDNGQIGVRLLGLDQDRATVQIGRELAGTRAIRVRRREVTLQPATETPTGQFTHVMTGSSCDLAEVELVASSRAARITIDASVIGYDNPVLTYVVGNRADQPLRVGAADQSGDPVTAQFTATCLVVVPTAEDQARSQTMNVPLSCTLTGHLLTIDVPSGLGEVQLPVSIQADERNRNLHPGAFRSELLEFRVLTFWIGLSREAAEGKKACLAALRDLGEDEVAPIELRPGDIWRSRLLERWGTLDLSQRAQVLADLIRVEKVPPIRRLDPPRGLGRRRPR